MITRLPSLVTEQLDDLLSSPHHEHYRSRLYALAGAVLTGVQQDPSAVSACLVDGHNGALLWLGGDWLVSLCSASGEMRLSLAHPVHALAFELVGRDGNSATVTIRRGEVEVVQLPIEHAHELVDLVARLVSWVGDAASTRS